MSEFLPWHSMDDVRYASDNAYDIPALDLTMQAQSILGNCYIWGSLPRRTPRPGQTYAFYTDDYKFSALIKHPDAILKTQCAAIVEPNFSTNSRTPLPVALYGIFLKRKIARYAQYYGIKVLVDLTVHPKFAEHNLLGVPVGWSSYAIRATKAFGLEPLLLNYQLAQAHAGIDTPYDFVYGGGRAVQELAQTHHWDWEPEQMAQIKNRSHSENG